MIVCYVIHDEECLKSARRVLSLPPNKEWQDSPNGDTSLSCMYQFYAGSAQPSAIKIFIV